MLTVTQYYCYYLCVKSLNLAINYVYHSDTASGGNSPTVFQSRSGILSSSLLLSTTTKIISSYHHHHHALNWSFAPIINTYYNYHRYCYYYHHYQSLVSTWIFITIIIITITIIIITGNRRVSKFSNSTTSVDIIEHSPISW